MPSRTSGLLGDEYSKKRENLHWSAGGKVFMHCGRFLSLLLSEETKLTAFTHTNLVTGHMPTEMPEYYSVNRLFLKVANRRSKEITFEFYISGFRGLAYGSDYSKVQLIA